MSLTTGTAEIFGCGVYYLLTLPLWHRERSKLQKAENKRIKDLVERARTLAQPPGDLCQNDVVGFKMSRLFRVAFPRIPGYAISTGTRLGTNTKENGLDVFYPRPCPFPDPLVFQEKNHI